LRSPFPPLNLVSGDEVEAIHRAALDILEDIGLRCQVKEARDLFRQAGARVDDSEGLVRLRSEERTSELQSLRHLVCRLLLEKKKKHQNVISS